MSQLIVPGDAAVGDVISGKKFCAGLNYNATGTLLCTGDAVEANVLSGKKFYKDDPKTQLTGTMANRTGDVLASSANGTETVGRIYFDPQDGYYPAGARVYRDDADWIAANLLKNKNIYGLVGTCEPVMLDPYAGYKNYAGSGSFITYNKSDGYYYWYKTPATYETYAVNSAGTVVNTISNPHQSTYYPLMDVHKDFMLYAYNNASPYTYYIYNLGGTLQYSFDGWQYGNRISRLNKNTQRIMSCGTDDVRLYSFAGTVLANVDISALASPAETLVIPTDSGFLASVHSTTDDGEDTIYMRNNGTYDTGLSLKAFCYIISQAMYSS